LCGNDSVKGGGSRERKDQEGREGGKHRRGNRSSKKNEGLAPKQRMAKKGGENTRPVGKRRNEQEARQSDVSEKVLLVRHKRAGKEKK